MTDHPAVREVSFFRLAEQYQPMSRQRRRRWRERRDTLAGRRRRRRARRRSHGDDAEYYPMVVDGNEAHRGVRSRLLGAVAAAVVTAICLVAIVAAPHWSAATAVAMTLAMGSFGVSMSLAVSARDEELVHEMAGRLSADLGDEPPRLEGPQWTLDQATADLERPPTLVDASPAQAESPGEDGQLEWPPQRCES